MYTLYSTWRRHRGYFIELEFKLKEYVIRQRRIFDVRDGALCYDYREVGPPCALIVVESKVPRADRYILFRDMIVQSIQPIREWRRTLFLFAVDKAPLRKPLDPKFKMDSNTYMHSLYLGNRLYTLEELQEYVRRDKFPKVSNLSPISNSLLEDVPVIFGFFKERRIKKMEKELRPDLHKKMYCLYGDTFLGPQVWAQSDFGAYEE